MRVIPLRNMVLVRLEDRPAKSPRVLVLIQDAKAVRAARVLAVGPECRELKPGHIALVNSIAGTALGDELLVPESAVLGTL